MVLSRRWLNSLLHTTCANTKGGPESYDEWNRSALQCASRRVVVNGRLFVCGAIATELAGTHSDGATPAAP